MGNGAVLGLIYRLGGSLRGIFPENKAVRLGVHAESDNIYRRICGYISEGFIIGKMWIVVSDEVEAAVRVLARKKGDISKIFEESLRMLLKERGIEIEGSDG